MEIWAIAAAAAAAVSAGINGAAAVRAEKSCEYRQAAPRAHLPLWNAVLSAPDMKQEHGARTLHNKVMDAHSNEASA